MPKASLDPARCDPRLCAGGICAVRQVCSVKAVFQEDAFEMPSIDWSRCRACSKCIAVCPSRAVSLVN